MPGTSLLTWVNADGTVTALAMALNLPTSMEFIGNTAYVVSLAGDIWVIPNVSPPPHGTSH